MGLAGINVLVVLLCKVIIYITINKLRIISMCDPYAYMVAVSYQFSMASQVRSYHIVQSLTGEKL